MHLTKRALLTATAGLILTLGLLTPGHSHAHLVQSEPADGAQVAALPEALRLVFSEPVEVGFSRFALMTFDIDAPPDEAERRELSERWREGTVPDGAMALEPVSTGADAEILLVHADHLAPGIHVVLWRVLSIDGHFTQGDVAFTLIPSGE